ncbi:Glycosyltransferase, partial [Aphelenchoides avenae]
MMPTEWIIAACLTALHASIVQFVYLVVPEPYMDELFHVDQTRRYCAGDYSWNPKITTPPALYVLALPFCGFERYINSLLVPLCYLGLCRLRRRICPKGDTTLTSLIVLSLPVLLQTSFLFYTDLLSLCTVVWGLGTASPTIAALIFGVGTLTRQTNILWALVYCACAACRELEPKAPFKSLFRCVLRHWAFAPLGGAFASFLVWNNGIVLGDRTAHEPMVHVPQLFYLSLFIVFSSFPVLVKLIPEGVAFIRNRLLLCILFLFFTCLCIHEFTYAHPYLLADNRHFTFY